MLETLLHFKHCYREGCEWLGCEDGSEVTLCVTVFGPLLYRACKDMERGVQDGPAKFSKRKHQVLTRGGCRDTSLSCCGCPAWARRRNLSRSDWPSWPFYQLPLYRSFLILNFRNASSNNQNIGGGEDGRGRIFTLAFPQGKAKVLILPRSIHSLIDSFIHL